MSKSPEHKRDPSARNGRRQPGDPLRTDRSLSPQHATVPELKYNSFAQVNPSSGTPAWITADLINDTIDTWQPFYDRELTADDALEILQNVAHVFDALE
jgi:hypothetical protein